MILVTGGTGLVGAHLLVSLTQKHDSIRAIHRKTSNLDAIKKVFSYYFDDITPFYSKIEWVEANITDTPSLEKAFIDITEVYHCAAMISMNPKAYRAMRKANIEGTANVVNFSVAQKVKKLCYVSSIAAVGRQINGGLIDESCEWNIETNNSGYAITKYGAEMEVWRGTQEGLDAVIVNPGIILGAGFFDSGSGSIFKKVHDGLRFYTEGITGYVDVKDVVKLMVLLMESSIKNERYILVSENKSFKEVFDEMAKGFDKKQPSIKLSKTLTEIAWRLIAVISKLIFSKPVLTRNSAKSLHNKNYFSSEKLKSEINFEFTPVAETISNVCKNYD